MLLDYSTVLVSLVWFLLSSSAVCAKKDANHPDSSAVVELTPENFDKIVLKSDKPALVEFYAPWCGHCKKLAPVYEDLAKSFSHRADKVIIGKVNADEHKALAKRFNIGGFPTLKWFPADKSTDPEDYRSGRDLDSLILYITQKTGVTARTPMKPPSKVVMLNDDNFNSIVGSGKNVFVAFTAPWCGHCQRLAPVWEQMANDFELEDSIVIAKVDAEAENSRSVAKAHNIKSYPTLHFFRPNSKDPIHYEGGREQSELMKYVNGQAGSHRMVGGGLGSDAGVISELIGVARRAVSSTADDDIIQLRNAVEQHDHRYAGYYVKVVERSRGDSGYIRKELDRLQRILKKGSLTPIKADDLTCRSNILRRFLHDEL